MGNGLSPCLRLPSPRVAMAAKVVYWGGSTRLVTDQCSSTAADVMAELPDHLVCPADSFFIGLPIPVLSPGEELLAGRTYFVLPAERFSCLKVLTSASLVSLSPAPAKMSIAGTGQCPFEYFKGDDGMALIRVLPAFIEKVIGCDNGRGNKCGAVTPELCSTPELRKHYTQLVVGPRERQWSPRLETISECGKRMIRMRLPRLMSPAR